jgi:hypothetical protein
VSMRRPKGRSERKAKRKAIANRGSDLWKPIDKNIMVKGVIVGNARNLNGDVEVILSYFLLRLML